MGRRTETTEYLKECIANALIRLMNDTPVEKIRIQEITESAGVGRMTWFRYFNSKTDALVFKLRQLWKEWGGENPCTGRIGSYEHALWFFSFWYSIRPLLSLLYRRTNTMFCFECSCCMLPSSRATSDGNSIMKCSLPTGCLGSS